MSYDKHHGKSGTFIVGTDGKRSPATPDKDGNITVGNQVLHRPETKPHKDGDAPRDAVGDRIDRGAEQQAQARPQPALPEPLKRAPWEAPPEEPKKTEKKEIK